MKNFTQLLSRFVAIFRYGDSIHPVRDWFTIIAVAVTLIIGSAGLNAWFFLSATHATVPSSSTSATQPFDTASLDAVKKIFDTRASERSHYQTDYRFVDPSQ